MSLGSKHDKVSIMGSQRRRQFSASQSLTPIAWGGRRKGCASWSVEVPHSNVGYPKSPESVHLSVYFNKDDKGSTVNSMEKKSSMSEWPVRPKGTHYSASNRSGREELVTIKAVLSRHV